MNEIMDWELIVLNQQKNYSWSHDNVTQAECESSMQILQAKNGETGGIGGGMHWASKEIVEWWCKFTMQQT